MDILSFLGEQLNSLLPLDVVFTLWVVTGKLLCLLDSRAHPLRAAHDVHYLTGPEFRILEEKRREEKRREEKRREEKRREEKRREEKTAFTFVKMKYLFCTGGLGTNVYLFNTFTLILSILISRNYCMAFNIGNNSMTKISGGIAALSGFLVCKMAEGLHSGNSQDTFILLSEKLQNSQMVSTLSKHKSHLALASNLAPS
ncbi:hypothetical protein llap_4044 [Limosa lapponica baueri]|uniref:Uncharacterized protein n=1 Tax=Limosa lapponica baueri TaxID=1758121 RepID=A0A2I0UI01_LIMLA|nr:hypothetical protein llap_4044 [Limosa lapponica baueri]